ncbi:MAG: glycerol-3-phosphate dehydrogenase [Pseudomonadales bacterium]|jgi:glycerol-3-phosphate dehydrogenase
MTNNVKVDIAIIGGGIAGLWLLNSLQAKGYSALLFEKNALGSDQTIASQGMIHGGVKYALSGVLSGESEAIVDMPDHWKACLTGEADVDLRDTKVLSEEFYMWSAGKLASKLTTFFASKALRGRIESLKAKNHPAVFSNKQFKGSVYKLVDVVLDAPSLIANLQANAKDKIFSIDWSRSKLESIDGNAKLCVSGIDIAAKKVVFAAGKGNGDLLAMLRLEQPAMQLRPLRQVVIKHSNNHMLYAHCIGASLSASPRLTISSHQCIDGKTAWYLGGDLSTAGVALSSDQLIAKAKTEITKLFPWLDWSDAEWATLYVDRAEPQQKGLVKPDNAFAQSASKDVITVWPTKLTLAPSLTIEVSKILADDNITPSVAENMQLLSQLATPDIAKPCWETLFK